MDYAQKLDLCVLYVTRKRGGDKGGGGGGGGGKEECGVATVA